MYNVFYAALERHICVNHPEWHKTAVFSTISVTLVQTSFIPIFVVLGILNLDTFQEQSQPLAFGFWHFQIVGSFFFGLLTFCLCGQMVLTKTKTIRDELLNENDNYLNDQKSMTRQNIRKSSSVLTVDNEISQLDFEAAKNFYFFVKLHLIFTALKLIPYICILICLQNNKQVLSSENPQPGSEAECAYSVKAFYFFCALLNCFYSSIANPVAFLFFILIKEGRPINVDEKHNTELS